MAALGIFETRGFVAAVEALDAMSKDAGVSVRQVKRPGGGHVSLLVEGEVAAVASALEAGACAAGRIGGDIICNIIIPNPHPELTAYLV